MQNQIDAANLSWTAEEVKTRLVRMRKVLQTTKKRQTLSEATRGIGWTDASTWALWSDFLVYHIHMKRCSAIGALFASCPGGNWATPGDSLEARSLIPHPRCGRVILVWREGHWATSRADLRAMLVHFMTHNLVCDSTPDNEEKSLSETVQELRAVKGSGWPKVEDPHAFLMTLRHGEDGSEREGS